jgi:DtxR family transcriptional regulator, Mn-dependent transcriptional regulator
VAPLSEARVGTNYEVTSVRSHNEPRLAKLATYGVIPGSRLRLIQKRPAFVIRVGETDLALDAEVARDILVRAVHP